MLWLYKSKPEVMSSSFLGFFPAYLILFPLDLGVNSPIDRPSNLIKGIYADSIPSASDSHENATLFHHNNRLERYSTNQGVRHGGGGSNEGYDIQTLGMAKKQIMGW